MKTGKWIGWVLLLGLVGVIFTVRAASAQTPVVTDDEVNAVAREMYCPVCENIPLDVCPTQACSQWRELIRLKLSEGWGKDQIKEYFAAQYGDRVLSEPPRQGLHWLIYILPPVFFLAGVFLVWRVYRNHRKPVAAAPAEPAPSTAEDEVLRRMEEDLRRREQQS